MKLNSLMVTMLGLGALLASVPSSARTWIEVGSEYEQYFNEPYTDHNGDAKTQNNESLNNYTPYILFSHTPNDGSWNLWGRYLKKVYVNEDIPEYYPTGIQTSMTERYEMYYTQMDRFGDLRLRSGFGARHNMYEIDRYETEYRVYPQFDYFLNKDNQLFLSGHFYLGDNKGIRNGDVVDGVAQAKKYLDWGYEFEFGLIHKLSPTSSIKPSIFTEYDEWENNYDIKFYQLRLAYTKKIGRATVSPFVRLGLDRTTTTRSHYINAGSWGKDTDSNYDRVGITGNVGISGQLNIVYETYWNMENRESHITSIDKYIQLPDRNKVFAKIGIQYIF